ncbi:MAG: hypothetical protein A2281_09490 [Bacteroidetes bacterium RIFOXYA12_FULL_38_20]|nr:MAG: hypothetical protein A2281_09490 [Bacteroidetes bacterium RIFOXYA12_FULL_38_20]
MSILILLVVFVSSTGINKHEHECKSMGSADVSYLPEYFGIHTECACRGILHHDEQHKSNTVVSGISCCKNSMEFFKVPVLNQNVAKFFQITTEYTPIILSCESRLNKFEDNSPAHAGTFYRPPPNIYCGRQLIYFTSNIKIPFPELI